MRPVAMASPVAPRMPMYPPGGPGIGQQLFYGQAPPAIIPSQVTLVLGCFELLGLSFSLLKFFLSNPLNLGFCILANSLDLGISSNLCLV